MYNRTYNLRLIARLLEYPDTALWEARGEMVAALASLEQPSEPLRQALNDFAEMLMCTDPLDVQASYVETFEYGRSTSLLLFEHVYGESRERGQAMVDLHETYRQAGLNPHSRELPDYLPLYLEYLSALPEEEAKEQLVHFAPTLSLLSARLHHCESPYAVLFDVLLRFCGQQGDESIPIAQIGNELPDNTPVAIDAAWQETQVRFGAPSACGTGASSQEANLGCDSQEMVFWEWGKTSSPSFPEASIRIDRSAQ